MTLFISDIKTPNRAKKNCISFVGVTLFCIIFSIIYEINSHQVYSNFMVFLFLFPLLFGTLPYGLFWKIKKIPAIGRDSSNLWNSGVATLTLGSAMQGALEIYGTSSPYMVVFWIVGILFLILGIVRYSLSLTKAELT